MIEKTWKVFSYCDDFTEEEQNSDLQEFGCDVYVEWTAYEVDGSLVGNKLFKLGCKEGEKVLIHIDY